MANWPASCAAVAAASWAASTDWRDRRPRAAQPPRLPHRKSSPPNSTTAPAAAAASLIAEARFPRLKRLADFKPDAVPAISPATLATGTWIDVGQPVVLLGDSGTGKTHCETSGRVFATEPHWV